MGLESEAVPVELLSQALWGCCLSLPGGRGQAPQQEVGKGVVYLICKIAILEWEKNRSFQGSLFRILQMLSCWRFLVMNVK